MAIGIEEVIDFINAHKIEMTQLVGKLEQETTAHAATKAELEKARDEIAALKVKSEVPLGEAIEKALGDAKALQAKEPGAPDSAQELAKEADKLRQRAAA